MSRFSHTVVAAVPPAAAWEDLQSAGTWGLFFGAHEVSRVQSNGDGQLAGCDWMTHLAGRRIEGTFTITKSEEPDRIVGTIDAGEWRGTVDVTLTEVGANQTSIRARLELEALGLTAMLVQPLVSGVIGREFPGRLEGFAQRLEETGG